MIPVYGWLIRRRTRSVKAFRVWALSGTKANCDVAIAHQSNACDEDEHGLDDGGSGKLSAAQHPLIYP